MGAHRTSHDVAKQERVVAAGAAAKAAEPRGAGLPRHPQRDELRVLIESCRHARRRWRQKLERLLEEDDRLHEAEEAALAAAIRRVQLLDAGGSGDGVSLKHLVSTYERSLILSALASAKGQQNRAAAALGVGLSTLNQKIKRLGIELP